LCPYKTDKIIKVAAKDQPMNNLIDYIWCRISEKAVRLSKVFRNMDINMVAY